MLETLSYSFFRNSALIPILLICCYFSIGIYLLFRLLPKKDPKEDGFLTRTDIRNILIVTCIYSIVSLYDLGSLTFPTTTWQPTSNEGQEVVFDFGKETLFDSIYIIYGEGNNPNNNPYQLGFHDTTLYGSLDNEEWEEIIVLEPHQIYQYKTIDGVWSYQYIKVESKDSKDTITELAFHDAKENRFIPIKVLEDSASNSKYPAQLMIDETDKVVYMPTYYDQSFFDEVYHVRNAWEVANGQDMYPNVHPLLGTNIIALFIKLFGMRPYIWRLPGALFGIAMVPLLYILLKRMFHRTSISTLGSILLGADFMHLTTSRIATLEPFSIFFIILMYYFMIRYYYTNFYLDTKRKQYGLLFACGLSMGLGIATKWTACYSAVGLAILLFTSLFQRFKE